MLQMGCPRVVEIRGERRERGRKNNGEKRNPSGREVGERQKGREIRAENRTREQQF